MADYYARADVGLWQEQQTGYAAILAAYDEHVAEIEAANQAQDENWQAAYAEWEAAPTPVEGPKAPPPEPPPPLPVPPPPEPPVSTLTVWASRDVTVPEEIATETGPALILPGRIILVGGAITFALTQAELDVAYVATTEVTLMPVGG